MEKESHEIASSSASWTAIIGPGQSSDPLVLHFIKLRLADGVFGGKEVG